MDLLKHIRNIPDFPKPGIQFKDITPLLQDPAAFAYVIRGLKDRYENAGLTHIVGIESRGFIFGAALAHELGLGFVPVRKLGKLPADTIQKSYELEYGEATIEVHKDAIEPGEKVLIVDDLLATGGTLAATVELMKEVGAEIAACWVLIELGFLEGRKRIDAPLHAELVI